jgi:hypothetical protein
LKIEKPDQFVVWSATEPGKTPLNLWLFVVFSLVVGMLVSLMMFALRSLGLRGQQGGTNGGQRQN